MPRFNIGFDAGWSTRKIPMMKRDLSRVISRQGASHIVFTQVEDVAETPAPPKMLRLGCRDCEKSNGKVYEGWEAQTFTPCPECGGRESVFKMPPPSEVSEPETEPSAEAAPSIQEPDAKPQPPLAAQPVDGT